MEFSPINPIVKLCLEGIALKAQNDLEQATVLFTQAWHQAENHLEKFITSYFMAEIQTLPAQRLTWLEEQLKHALLVTSDVTKSAMEPLYNNISLCYTALGNLDRAEEFVDLAANHNATITDKGPFYHGTRAVLKFGDFLKPGNESNYQHGLAMNHINFTSVASGAALAAALAKGQGTEHVYIVQPQGEFENDPNVTNMKFPGNPTKSYRSSYPLKIIGQLEPSFICDKDMVKKLRDKVDKASGNIIN